MGLDQKGRFHIAHERWDQVVMIHQGWEEQDQEKHSEDYIHESYGKQLYIALMD